MYTRTFTSITVPVKWNRVPQESVDQLIISSNDLNDVRAVLDGYSADHTEKCLCVSHKTTTKVL